MKSRGKKPLGNEGKHEVDDPVVLTGEDADGAEAPYGTFFSGYRINLLLTVDFDQTSMMTTYRLVEAVLEERMRSLPVALVKNTVRHGASDRWADWLASAGAGFAAGAAIDPVLGVAVAVVGGMARNVIEVFRLRRGRHKEIAPGRSKAGAEVRMVIQEMLGDLPTKIDLRGKLPDLPEFNNEWVRLAHRLIRLSKGYNVRVEVVNRIRLELARGKMAEDKAVTLANVAAGMAAMLLEVRPRLEEVGRTLVELQPLDFKNLRKLEEHDDLLQTNDLLGEDRGEAATLLWLDVPYPRILIRDAARVHETDKAVREGRIELDEELSLERRFVRLEEKLDREREQLENDLADLVVRIENLPPEERPAAEERLESIRERLREIASLDATIEIEVEDERIGE
ncbi:MAG TPA: hypothetical protein VJ694_00375 [Patescibacteria group bacterium]|nr:hypothetical protein [Patescibacteria group bacterium]